MDLEFKAIMLEVFLDLFTVDVIDVQVCHCESAAPASVAFGQLTVLWIEDSIKEGKVVRDLFVPVYVKAILSFDDRSYEIRHVEI